MFHTLSQTPLARELTMSLATQDYLKNLMGPVDIPTPDEARAEIVIRSLRREIHATIDYRSECKIRGVYDSNAIVHSSVVQTMEILISSVKNQVAVIRRERARRGIIR